MEIDCAPTLRCQGNVVSTLLYLLFENEKLILDVIEKSMNTKQLTHPIGNLNEIEYKYTL